MGARQKLNSAYINGAILMAVAFGFATQSFLVAFCVFALFVGMGCHTGDIRPAPGKRR